MIGGEVEDDSDAVHGRASDSRLAQIAFDKTDAAGFYVVFDIAQAAAGEIVHHVDAGSALDEGIHQVRTDEGSAARDENFLMIPDDALRLSLLLLL